MTNLEYLVTRGMITVNQAFDGCYIKGVNIVISLRDKDYLSFSNKKDISWLLEEHKEPIKLTRMEYDLLKCYAVGKTEHGFNGIDCLRKLKDEGHFKGVDETMKIKNILNDCEIIE